MDAFSGGVRGLAVAFAVAFATALPGAAGEPAKEAILAAIDHPQRPPEDREADPFRRPADVLGLLGVAPGLRVAELMAGGGWYSELLAHTVGATGRVYAQNNRISGRNYDKRLSQRLAGDRLPNVERVDAELEALPFPPGELDAAMLVQFYHDTFWMGVDREAMNRGVFQALRPGGAYLVIDHASLPGAGGSEARRLHRVEEDLVVEEVTRAGFALEARQDWLRNPDDAREWSAFDPRVRGRTDRFLLLFRRPDEAAPAR